MISHAPTELRLKLLDAGFAPIPLYGKAPPIYGKNNQRKGLAGWEKLQRVSVAQVTMWGKTWPDACNTGALTGAMPTFDADIKNPEAAEAIEALARKRYEDRGLILVRIGQPPKRAIPFRTNQPFAKVVANLVAPNGEKGQKIEMLCDGQQVVVAGIHPDTKEPYRWHGGMLGEVKWGELPELGEAEARALVEDAAKLLIDEYGYKRVGEPTKGNGKGNSGHGWSELLDNIRAGEELHGSICALAAKMISHGMERGAADELIRDAMRQAPEPHDARWRERYDDISRAVHTAWKKFKAPAEETPKPLPAACDLNELHAVFRKWLGAEYDLDVIDVIVAVAAAEQLGGDPAWLLVVSGPGAAKTESVQALAGCGAHVTSTIQSEGALLSASSKKSHVKGATGGLLRKIGDRGILVIKDVTSILSADRNVRAAVLAALREVHDGRWERNVGSDGGQTLTWTGRLAVVGAVTSAWDQAHGVVATMGDRFVLIRADSDTNAVRLAAGMQALKNLGKEIEMRRELAAAVGGVVASVSEANVVVTPEEYEQLLAAANIVTKSRTAAARDYQGEIIDADAAEMPTRFAKQLMQIMRGAMAVGMARVRAMALAIRCARDSIPPLRSLILLDVASNPDTRPGDTRRRINKPWRTTKREMEALTHIGVLVCDEETEPGAGDGGRDKIIWRYRLHPQFDRATLLAMTATKATGDDHVRDDPRL
jgi:hypothetical protein